MMPSSTERRNVSNLFKRTALCIMFVLSLLRPLPTNPVKFISERYDRNLVKFFRRMESNRKKLCKIELDLVFLKKCKVYDVIPKFLRFKLHRKSLQSSQFYKSWVIKLLDKEIKDKTIALSKAESRCKLDSTELANYIS